PSREIVGGSELRCPLDAFGLGVLQPRGRPDVLGGCHADEGDHVGEGATTGNAWGEAGYGGWGRFWRR
ncbi:MAG: hypothetical protein PVH41_19450, partial [Anaerolineae bacterium]